MKEPSDDVDYFSFTYHVNNKHPKIEAPWHVGCPPVIKTHGTSVQVFNNRFLEMMFSTMFSSKDVAPGRNHGIGYFLMILLLKGFFFYYFLFFSVFLLLYFLPVLNRFTPDIVRKFLNDFSLTPETVGQQLRIDRKISSEECQIISFACDTCNKIHIPQGFIQNDSSTLVGDTYTIFSYALFRFTISLSSYSYLLTFI